MRRLLKGARWFLVTVGVILLTSVTIDATTSYNISQSALGILAREVTETGCPAGTVEMASGERRLCVDVYEVSPSEECAHSEVVHADQTRANVDQRTCVPQSIAGTAPWVHVTIHQARELCARAGKRLPTHREWYQAALGVVDASRNPECNVDSNTLLESGERIGCVSGIGAFDMVGNAWEWIEGEVSDGEYSSRSLPETGYVNAADAEGVALATSEDAHPDYHDDYFWSNQNGVYSSIRGGFYGSGSDAGIYSIHADIPPGFSGSAVGFRCVKDL